MNETTILALILPFIHTFQKSQRRGLFCMLKYCGQQNENLHRWSKSLKYSSALLFSFVLLFLYFIDNLEMKKTFDNHAVYISAMGLNTNPFYRVSRCILLLQIFGRVQFFSLQFFSLRYILPCTGSIILHSFWKHI